MELQGEVLEEMALLRKRAPDVSGSVVCSVDGLRIASDLAGDHGEQAAALSAAMLAMSGRMLTMTGRGAFEETLISGSAGFVACYAAGPTVVLTVLAGPGANVGLLRLEGRRTAAGVAAVVAREP
ncbi:roadblock/LC7 domain-containing protein [Spongiactinospora sp. TRM90649]|uniref:roadblock/LC7 domain-containing protein n=1 Tax=Spongiactinospora sp. TRM90649 TaxID=3031114 RepID=UPI0023F9F705|nr:roadblock/LC7 domain-containing protein [Spongiactinospora sp. TRM90649]MDF5757667.1 roadblock/LC7 domain-containing protein [Spongiactinospora sp. TRM90649]